MLDPHASDEVMEMFEHKLVEVMRQLDITEDTGNILRVLHKI